MTSLPDAACPACGHRGLEGFYEQPGVPVHSCLLIDAEEEARSFPTGDLGLALCSRCGFITNACFRPELNRYSEQYEETQGFSPRFRAFAADLAGRWVDRYDLVGRHVVEIGCGKGEFLQLVCELGGNTGTGLDPSWVPSRSEPDPRLAFRQQLYDDGYGPLGADAVICRHTLEHISPVGEFLRTLRHGIGDRRDTVVLFEVPDTRRVLEEADFWDVYYEHCSYFTAGSLARAFRRAGFEVLDVRTEFDDQYLVLEALPAGDRATEDAFDLEADLDVVQELAADFAPSVARRVAGLRCQLLHAVRCGRRVALWGAGSKGVAFLVALDAPGLVSDVVDINPFKQGRYLPVTGHQVAAPDRLAESRPDLVVVMNPVYTAEIAAELGELGLAPDLLAV